MPTQRVTISKRYCFAALVVCVVMMTAWYRPLCSQVILTSSNSSSFIGNHNWILDNTQAHSHARTGVSPLQGDQALGIIMTQINIELEDLAGQSLFSPFEVLDDPDASGGRFIVWPQLGGNIVFNPPSNTSQGQVRIEFTLSETADVTSEIRADFPTSGDNSFYYRIDGGAWTIRNGDVTNGWEIINFLTINNLAAGTHTFDIHRRENGSLLDRFTMTASNGVISSSTVSDGSTSLSGSIFLDANDNGLQDVGEQGIADIIVSAFDDSGLVAQSTSTPDGSYSFDGLDSLTQYQIIFEGWETDYVESSLGPDNSGSIQQAFPGSENVSLGLRVADTACSDPYLVIPCYVEGDLTTSGSEPAILKLPSSANGHDFAGTNPLPDYQAETIASYDDVGTVYGIAWQQSTRRYYAGAFHKRYTSFGPAGPDAIYQLDLTGNLTGIINLDDITFVNDVAGPDVHDFSSSFGGSLLDLGVGNASFDGAGKRSLGDIEMDDDFTTLYVMNLFDRIIYAVDVSTGIASDASIVNSWPAPDATLAGRHRPFGLAWHDDKLWIGSVDEDGSEAYVHSLDIESGSFDLALSIPLNYPRQAFLGTATNTANAPAAWNPWQSTPNFDPFNVDNEIAFPQAMLSDIEFSDDGDMILGFRDRFGDQGGADKFFNVGDPDRTWVISQGDILKACLLEVDATFIDIELEDLSGQSLFSPFEVMDDPDAFGGQFIVWPQIGGNRLFNQPTDTSPGQVRIEFTLTETADVDFQIRANFPRGADNSFFYRIDGGNWLVRNGGTTNGWDVLNILTFNNLPAGTHTLDIHRRENGSMLDRVRLTTSDGAISSPVALNQVSSGSFFSLESGLAGDCPADNSGLANSGPSNKEFYYWDIYALPGRDWNPGADNGAFHWETTQGGLVQIPGSPSIITTALDPFDDFSGGVLKLDNTTGAREGAPLIGPVNPNNLVGGYTIYESGDFNAGLPIANGFSGKANGLGDLEAACAVDYTIGNFVWFDEDQDGRQDPDESPLSGVTVELFAGDELIGSSITNENGHYFFGGTSGAGLIDNTSLSPGIAYQIRISLDNVQNNTSGITNISGTTEPNATEDRLDSDALSNNSFAFIDVVLDDTQLTDYTYDFGFASCGVSLISYLDDTSLCQGEQLTIFADVPGDSVSNHSWTVSESTTSSGFTLSGTSDSTITIDALDAAPGLIRLLHKADSDGCPVSDSIDIFVHDKPDIEVISSLDSTCIGEEVELSAVRPYLVVPQGGFVPPSQGPGFSIDHSIFDITDPVATQVTITLPVWDDHFAETTLNGQVIIPIIPEPNSWNAGGMDTETPWLPNVNGLPRSVIEISQTSIRYFRTRTTTSAELEEVFPTNWVSTPQPFRPGENIIGFGILNTSGPVGGTWTITAEAVVGYDYLWSTGDTTQTITDMPREVTDYMVTVTNAQNCSSVVSKTIYAGTNNTESITYEGCSGDGYEVLVNGTIYNEANPTDTIVINTISGCDSTFFINLVYDIPPIVEAGSLPTPLCSTSILTLDDLDASISGGVSRGIWTSTGGGFFDNGGLFGGSNSATTYTPSQGEIDAGKFILTLTSDDPPGSCEPEADAVMVIINDIRCNTFPWSGG